MKLLPLRHADRSGGALGAPLAPAIPVARIAATTKTVKHAPPRSLTVRGFVAEWLLKRRERGLDWKADEGRLNRHPWWPELGGRAAERGRIRG